MSAPPFLLTDRGLLGRRTHRSPDVAKEASWSHANSVTAARCLVGGVLLTIAALHSAQLLLVVAVVLCWLGDIIDGLVARSLCCESVLGAQMDSYADRVIAFGVLGASVAVGHADPLLCAAAAITWVQFGVVDQFLSSQFLRYDLWTSDELHLVDERLWRLNFAPFAKIVSNVPVALIIIGHDTAYVAVSLALAIMGVRVVTFALRARVLRDARRGASHGS